MIELRGSTWDHVRGYAPLPATAQAYMAGHPDVRVIWEKRTLQDFAEMSLPALAQRYDFIVLDHPWLGACETAGALLPLEQYLPADYLADQAHNSVGKSHESYHYNGHQWALAVDAASHSSAYRPDLLAAIGADLPATWEAVLELARARRGQARAQVAVPLMHVDTLPCFVSLCANAGEEPFVTPEAVVSPEVGQHALEMLRVLVGLCHPGSLGWNPPQLLDHMSETDEIAYCPLLFCYSNYSRPGFRPQLVRFANVPLDASGVPRGAILGGAGLAVSAATQHPEVASDYAAFVAHGDVQRTIYFESGGQPGHRTAWTDPKVNAASHDFFRDILPTLDHAYLRPRYDGWIDVQDGLCVLLHRFLKTGGDVRRTLDEMDALYRQSRAGH